MSRTEKHNAVFPTRLRKLLNENHITITALAAELGISRQAVAQYADGGAQPNIDKLRAIAKYFHVSVDYLIGFSECEIGLSESDLELIYDCEPLTDSLEELRQRNIKLRIALYEKNKLIEKLEIYEQTVNNISQTISLCESTCKRRERTIED